MSAKNKILTIRIPEIVWECIVIKAGQMDMDAAEFAKQHFIASARGPVGPLVLHDICNEVLKRRREKENPNQPLQELVEPPVVELQLPNAHREAVAGDSEKEPIQGVSFDRQSE